MRAVVCYCCCFILFLGNPKAQNSNNFKRKQRIDFRQKIYDLYYLYSISKQDVQTLFCDEKQEPLSFIEVRDLYFLLKKSFRKSDAIVVNFVEPIEEFQKLNSAKEMVEFKFYKKRKAIGLILVAVKPHQITKRYCIAGFAIY